jgi:hypothetical protein
MGALADPRPVSRSAGLPLDQGSDLASAERALSSDRDALSLPGRWLARPIAAHRAHVQRVAQVRGEFGVHAV